MAESTPARAMQRVALLFAALALAACATTAPPPEERDPTDPWEPFNRNMYQFNRSLDKAILRPIARGYDTITPDRVQNGIGNFFTNLRSIPTVLNLVLQGRFGDAGQQFERLFLNSTFGVLGFIDVATKAELPDHQANFGSTLAHWGWKQSRYLVLPFLGPSTGRDTVGVPVDIYSNFVWRELASGRYYIVAVNIIDTRAGVLHLEEELEQAFDEYLFVRDAWMQRRNFIIHGEDAPAPDYDAFLDEDWDEEDW